MNTKEKQQLTESLKQLSPWRKGPIDFFDIKIDTEWKSNLKWDRIQAALPKLTDKKVIDVGCGNGYYMFRMLEFQPHLVLGVDPSWLFYYQFQALQHYCPQAPQLFFLPCDITKIYHEFPYEFDALFCMGVLYHRKNPIDFLIQLRQLLRPFGTLILEGLYWPEDKEIAFCPPISYAKMKNVYFLPTLATLKSWLIRASFENIEVIDTHITTNDEQRSTEWMKYESLADFLDPTNPDLTVEGYPRPHRFVIKANSKTL